MTKVAVVTGSNKGIGFAIVKGLLERFDGVVHPTSRDDGRGKAAVSKLNDIGLKPEYHQLDVTDRLSIGKFRDHIINNHDGIDILIYNAGVANSQSLYNSYDECKYIVDINYFGVLNIQEILFPLMKKNGRILNISSDCGHLINVRNTKWIQELSNKYLNVNKIKEFVNWFLEEIRNVTFNYDDLADKGTVAAYRVAKVAVSALTMGQQKDLEHKNISVNSMHPGLVQTDMTRGLGFFTAEQVAETSLYLVLEAPQSLKGAYVWYDRKVLDWYDYNADYYFKTKILKPQK